MADRGVAFLVDAQLSPALAKAIAAAGFVARHVSDVGLLQAADGPIWDYARDHGCALITKDEDFVSMRLRGKDGVAVVWLRIRNSSRQALVAWFMPRLLEVVALIEAGEPLIELR